MRRTERIDLIGRVILDWRERRGFTREELARRSGLGVSSIGAYERGERRPGGESLARICIALDVEPETLFGEVARVEADALRPLIEAVRKDHRRVEGKKQPAGSPELGDLLVLAARVSSRCGDSGGLDALVRLISRIHLRTPTIEPEPGPG